MRSSWLIVILMISWHYHGVKCEGFLEEPVIEPPVVAALEPDTEPVPVLPEKSATELFEQSMIYWNNGEFAGFLELFAEDAEIFQAALPGVHRPSDISPHIEQTGLKLKVSDAQIVAEAASQIIAELTMDLERDGHTFSTRSTAILEAHNGRITAVQIRSHRPLELAEFLREKTPQSNFDRVLKVWNSGIVELWLSLTHPEERSLFIGWEKIYPGLGVEHLGSVPGLQSYLAKLNGDTAPNGRLVSPYFVSKDGRVVTADVLFDWHRLGHKKKGTMLIQVTLEFNEVHQLVSHQSLLLESDALPVPSANAQGLVKKDHHAHHQHESSEPTEQKKKEKKEKKKEEKRRKKTK